MVWWKRFLTGVGSRRRNAEKPRRTLRLTELRACRREHFGHRPVESSRPRTRDASKIPRALAVAGTILATYAANATSDACHSSHERGSQDSVSTAARIDRHCAESRFALHIGAFRRSDPATSAKRGNDTWQNGTRLAAHGYRNPII
jgi:hypothetical protein